MTIERDVIFKLALPKPCSVRVVQITYNCIELQIDTLAIRFAVDQTVLKNQTAEAIRMFIPEGAKA
jgi:hypothetical protein